MADDWHWRSWSDVVRETCFRPWDQQQQMNVPRQWLTMTDAHLAGVCMCMCLLQVSNTATTFRAWSIVRSCRRGSRTSRTRRFIADTTTAISRSRCGAFCATLTSACTPAAPSLNIDENDYSTFLFPSTIVSTKVAVVRPGSVCSWICNLKVFIASERLLIQVTGL